MDACMYAGTSHVSLSLSLSLSLYIYNMCVRACVRACVRVRVCVCVCAFASIHTHTYSAVFIWLNSDYELRCFRGHDYMASTPILTDCEPVWPSGKALGW